jgi:thiamine-phosphate pyrophosphorylase
LRGLQTVAARLKRQRCDWRGPSLWLLSDPARAPGIERLAKLAPPASGLIYRHYGAPDEASMRRARRECRRKGVMFLLSADPRSKRVCDGVHLPAARAAGLRRRCQGLVTISAHDAREVRRGLGLRPDALILSPVFPSRSPSAGKAIGVLRFALWLRRIPRPVIALGGVNARTAGRLVGSGAAGLAGVGAFAPL